MELKEMGQLPACMSVIVSASGVFSLIFIYTTLQVPFSSCPGLSSSDWSNGKRREVDAPGYAEAGVTVKCKTRPARSCPIEAVDLCRAW